MASGGGVSSPRERGSGKSLDARFRGNDGFRSQSVKTFGKLYMEWLQQCPKFRLRLGRP